MKKELTVKIEVLPNNTPQNWAFSKDVSGIEQLALWVILRELADKNIKKLLS
jgi:hypothetical protein